MRVLLTKEGLNEWIIYRLQSQLLWTQSMHERPCRQALICNMFTGQEDCATFLNQLFSSEVKCYSFNFLDTDVVTLLHMADTFYKGGGK